MTSKKDFLWEAFVGDYVIILITVTTKKNLCHAIIFAFFFFYKKNGRNTTDVLSMGRSNLSLNLFKSDQYINWLKNTENKSTIPPEVTCTSEGDKTLRFMNKACMIYEQNLVLNFTSVKKVGTIKFYSQGTVC